MYVSLLTFLEDLYCQHAEGLKTSKTVTYKSDKVASDIRESMAHLVRSGIDKKLQFSA